jgi:hypothetical protein
MTEKNTPANGDKKTETPTTGKKPYIKPDFRFEKVFETLALVCAKLPPTLVCKQGGKTPKFS